MKHPRSPAWSLLLLGFLTFTSGDAAAAAEPLPPAAISVPTTQQLATSRAAARSALDELLSWLATGRDQGAGWRRVLQLSDALAHLDNESPESLAILENSWKKFYQDLAGLELKPFRTARAALGNYLQDLRATVAMGNDEFTENIAALHVGLQSPQVVREPAEGRRIAAALRWLTERNQAETMTTQLRSHYEQSNLLARVRADLMTAFVDQPTPEPVDERDASDELRTRSVGQAHVRVELVPVTRNDAAAFWLRSHMVMPLSTRASQGPATVFLSSTTKLDGKSEVVVTPYGYRTSPTISHGGTCMGVRGACTKFRGPLDKLVQRVAKKKAREATPSGNARITREARERLHRDVDTQLAAELAQQWQDYQAELRLPLLRRGIWPADARLTTDSSSLRVAATLATTAQFGAAGSPPHAPDDGPLSLRMHESLIVNYLEAVIGGEMMGISELEDELRGLGLGPSSGDDFNFDEGFASSSQEEDEIYVVFTESRPIDVAFDTKQITISVHGQNFLYRGRYYPAMDIALSFELELSAAGLLARQLADPLIQPPNLQERETGRLSGSEVAIRRILRNRLERDLPQVIELADRELNIEGIDPTYGPLLLSRVQSAGGWLEVDTRKSQVQSIASFRRGR